MRRALPIVVVVCSIMASATPAGAVSRTPARCPDLFRREIPPIRVADEPTSIVSADFDGDGRDDLALAVGGAVTVLTSRPDGRFASHTTGLSWPAAVLVAGDLNSDGRPDLVASGYGSRRATVLIGNGLGGFAELPGPELAQVSMVRAVARIDADPHPDVLVMGFGDTTTSTYEVLRGDGSGALTPTGAPLRFPSGRWGAAVGDFDGDARNDVVLDTTTTGSLSVALNDGAGGFGRLAPAIEWNYLVFQFAPADFNHDGRLDLGIDPVGGALALKGTGDGRFTLFPASRRVSLRADYSGAITADFDGDGNVDLAHTTRDGDGEIYVWLGDGRGRFAIAAGSPEWGGRYEAAPAVTGDFDGDGRPDLAGASRWQRNVRVLLNTGGHGKQAIRFVQATPKRLVRGDEVRLAARLRCHPGKLELYRRTLERRRWRRLATVATDYRGMATYADAPRRSVEYRWRPAGRVRGVKPTRVRRVRVLRPGVAARQ
jgi:FG-GAP-like repeat